MVVIQEVQMSSDTGQKMSECVLSYIMETDRCMIVDVPATWMSTTSKRGSRLVSPWVAVGLHNEGCQLYLAVIAERIDLFIDTFLICVVVVVARRIGTPCLLSESL